MNNAIFLVPAAMFFLAASMLFSSARKAAPERARISRLVGGVAFVAGKVLLLIGGYFLFTAE